MVKIKKGIFIITKVMFSIIFVRSNKRKKNGIKFINKIDTISTLIPNTEHKKSSLSGIFDTISQFNNTNNILRSMYRKSKKKTLSIREDTFKNKSLINLLGIIIVSH